MSPASATLRIESRESPGTTLRSVIASSTEPAEIATAVLAAAREAIASSGGAVLVDTAVPGEQEVLAATPRSGYSRGMRIAAPAAPRGSRALPLIWGGRECGQILLLDAAPTERADEDLLDSINLAAAILPPLLEAEALRNRLDETNAIVEVGQALTGMLAIDDVLSHVVYLAETLVRGNCATIALLSPDGGELVLRNSTGALRNAEGAQVPVAGSLIGWVVRNGEPVVTPNISDDPRSFALAVRQGPGLVVPIQVDGGSIGAFVVARSEAAERFTGENLETLQKIAAYAAIAIINAQLYREQKDAATALQAQADELQEAYSELHRQQEQLIIAEKMAALGRITAGIAHEINSPLGGIMNSVRAARGYAEEYQASIGDREITHTDHQAIADDMIAALTLAENASTKVAQFVRSIKTQTRPGAGQYTPFDPAAEITATLLLLQHHLNQESVQAQTDLDTDLTLTGDPGKFALVVQNLVSNAVDAYEGEPGAIRIRLLAVDAAILLEISDDGSGIPEEIRSRIFDYLFTTKDVGKGTGLGLAMVHSVVTGDFGGTIEIDSEVGRGTTFRLTFPSVVAVQNAGLSTTGSPPRSLE